MGNVLLFCCCCVFFGATCDLQKHLKVTLLERFACIFGRFFGMKKNACRHVESDHEAANLLVRSSCTQCCVFRLHMQNRFSVLSWPRLFLLALLLVFFSLV